MRYLDIICSVRRPSEKVKADVAQQRCIIIYTYYRRYGIWGIRYIIIYRTIIKLCGSAAAVFACFVGSSATVYDDIKKKNNRKVVFGLRNACLKTKERRFLIFFFYCFPRYKNPIITRTNARRLYT